MGIALILFIAACLLAWRLGLTSFLMTLFNPAKAKFIRYDNGSNQTVFDVTPARPSWTIILICVVVYFIGHWFLQTTKSGFLPFFIWLFIPVFIFFFLMIGVRYRKPAHLTVSGNELTNGKRSWPLTKIASLYIRKGSRRGEEKVGSGFITNPVTGYVSGGKSTSSLIGKAMGGKMAQRSYLLKLRTREGSQEVVLAGGLTLETAESLLQDLNETIRAHQSQ